MMHDCKRCLTCRRLDAERREADRADLIGLVAVVLGVACVCALCWILGG